MRTAPRTSRAACRVAPPTSTELRRQAEIILADVGGAVHGTSPYDLAKLEAILCGEALMGAAAHNIGAARSPIRPR